jgi:hypothetical protein
MTIKVKDSGGTLRTVVRASVMAGGTLRPLKSVKVKDSGGTLRTVFAGLNVTPNYSAVSGFGTTTPIYSTPTTVVTATGGTGPYTYLWTVVEDDALGTPSITSSTSASTTFQSTDLANFTPHTVTFRCTVTDSLAVTGSCDVTVVFTKTGGELP